MVALIEKFLEIENKHNLLNEQFDGFCYWQYIRFSLFREIEYQTIFNRNEKTKPKFKILSLLKNVTIHSLRKFRKKCDLFIVCSVKYSLDSERYSCIYLDPIIGADYFSYVICNNNKNTLDINKHDYNDVVNFLDLYIFTRLCMLLPSKNITLSENIKCAIDELNKSLGCCIELQQICNLIRASYIKWKYGKKYFKKALMKVDPKAIFEVCSYDFHTMLITEVAKELNIPVIELQHGIMGKGHVAYNFSKKQELVTFPNKVFTYSEYWKETTRFPIQEDSIIPTGFPYLEESVKTYLRQIDVDKINTKTIVVISQWPVAKKVSEFAVDLYDYLEKNYEGKFSIIYKMHPAETLANSVFDKLRKYKTKIKIVENNEKSLYQCFSEATAQISVSSTGIYEGLAFGLETFILQVDGSERLQDLADMGYAKYILQPKDVEFDVEYNQNEMANAFWKENALQNIQDGLKSILCEEETCCKK